MGGMGEEGVYLVIHSIILPPTILVIILLNFSFKTLTFVKSSPAGCQ